jgi:hypothetical protein
VLQSYLSWIGQRVASVVSLNAAQCLTQRRSDLQVLKPLVGSACGEAGRRRPEKLRGAERLP